MLKDNINIAVSLRPLQRSAEQMHKTARTYSMIAKETWALHWNVCLIKRVISGRKKRQLITDCMLTPVYPFYLPLLTVSPPLSVVYLVVMNRLPAQHCSSHKEGTISPCPSLFISMYLSISFFSSSKHIPRFVPPPVFLAPAIICIICFSFLFVFSPFFISLSFSRKQWWDCRNILGGEKKTPVLCMTKTMTSSANALLGVISDRMIPDARVPDLWCLGKSLHKVRSCVHCIFVRFMVPWDSTSAQTWCSFSKATCAASAKVKKRKITQITWKTATILAAAKCRYRQVANQRNVYCRKETLFIYKILLLWWWWWRPLSNITEVVIGFRTRAIGSINFILINSFSEPLCPMDWGALPYIRDKGDHYQQCRIDLAQNMPAEWPAGVRRAIRTPDRRGHGIRIFLL